MSDSHAPATTKSSSNFKKIFEDALEKYKIKTKQVLTTHSLATQLQSCDSPAAILTILQDQVDKFKQSRSGDERLQKWLNPTINVLYAFSATLGEGIGLVFSPAKVIFAGAGVLLLAAKEVEASQDILIDIFGRIEKFFLRLEVYTEVAPTAAMTDMMVNIMVEVLDILGTATKEMKQSRAKKFLKKVAGIRTLDDGMKKLDKMTIEEAQMAGAEVLRIAHNIDKKVEVVDEKVQTMIDDGKEAATEALVVMKTTASNVDDVKRTQLRENLRKWQAPSDPSTNHLIASDCQHEGTAEWFCKGDVLEEWRVNGSLLWIHGKPGSGKSILCSAIIKDIEALHKAGSASIAYFYFDFRDLGKQSRRDLLRSLLIQLSARSDPFCDIFSRLYKEHDDGTRQPSDRALMYCLKEMLTLPDQRPIYVIMDALDECPNTSGIPSSRKQVLDLVKELVDLRLPSLHICVTSRAEVDIQYALEPLAFRSVSLHDESGQKQDIAEYIKSVVHASYTTFMKRWREDDKDLVIKTLSARADGMFRWVFCQLEVLQNCLPQNVPRVLSQLPATLDETYERVLKEIGKTNHLHALRLLQCLTVAKRPLYVWELGEILALDFEAEEGTPELKEDWRWEDQQEAVLSTCSSLIAIVGDPDCRVVQFSHFSVKEFLTSDRLATSGADISRFHILPEPAHTFIVKACLGILLQLENDAGDAGAEPRSPLALYAADHWTDHARFENVWTRVEDEMRRLFDAAEPHLEVWLGLLESPNPERFFVGYDRNKNLGSPLYYASLYGLRGLAALLVAENPHITGLVGRNLSPLVAALRNRDFQIAELLYQHGADLGIRDDNNMTLLHAASEGGFVDISKWLLDHSVLANSQQENHETSVRFTEANGHCGHGSIPVDTTDDTNSTALHYASLGGHFEIVQQLLIRGADVTKKDEVYKTPLHLASYLGNVEAVRLLIERGANVTAQDRMRATPLHLALSVFHKAMRYDLEYPDKAPENTVPETVRLLIKHGADVNAPDIAHWTPLYMASFSGTPETVQILIENGADVNGKDRTHSTPLHVALFLERNHETVRLLIEHGADVTSQDWTHTTPLHLASSQAENVSWGYDQAKPNAKAEIVRLLIKHGADVAAQDMTHSTPLHMASSKGSAETVWILIEHGADVTAKNEAHSTPLHMASFNSSAETVKLLIDHGADVTVQDGRHRTPLHLALSTDNGLRLYQAKPKAKVDTVRVLIEHGADVTARDEAYSTPLHLASFGGGVETVQLLIEHGADVIAQDGSHRTPLHLASSWDDSHNRGDLKKQNEKANTVKLLIEYGADVSVQDNTHSTPLHLAAFSGSAETVLLLLEYGADATIPDGSHKTPLHLASSRYHDRGVINVPLSALKIETVSLLLQLGMDVTARDESHSTPLHLASSSDIPEIMQLLIGHGADVTARDGGGRTPLHLFLASSADDRDHMLNDVPKSYVQAATVRLLIEHGADVTSQDETHTTPLHLASYSGNAEVVRLLIEHGADVTARDRSHRTPLHLASSKFDCDIMQPEDRLAKSNEKAEIVLLLLELGADVTAQDESHSTPLHLASSSGIPEISRLLLSRDADVTAQDWRRRTPLHLASSWDDSAHMLDKRVKSHAKADIVRLLIEYGADVTAQDETHSTPLHLASSKGRAKTAQILIEHGADVTALDDNRRTPLHLASSRDGSDDQADAVRLLIRHGADVTARDDTHSTPLHLASSQRSIETVMLLIQHGADVNAQNGNQSTPLHLAASSHLAPEGGIVRLLLEHGANINAKDSEGRTPPEIASSEGHYWIAKLLSDHHARTG